MQGFFGHTSYYPRFIEDFGKIAQPLTAFSGKEGLSRNVQQWTFQQLKQCLASFSVSSTKFYKSRRFWQGVESERILRVSKQEL
ncbi:hypothetical protein L195_g001493 [Trifolium pratense]|uniref:Uncharacterized protein n=1 Tax=Trifolium pratense TaxID=57577 RepID=A0A2K3NPU5_TRIPR|nr:hypothetical protein L195_g001493 [Trifolium pratense]